MQPENITIVLRERESHEAADLGVRLVQRHFSAVYRPWLLLTIPFAAAVFVASWFWPGWAMLAFWFAIIVFERSVLYTLSRAVFGVVPSTLETVRAFFATEQNGIFWQLTLLRLSPNRSTHMAFLQLERSGIQQYFQRARMLFRSDWAHAVRLDGLCECRVAGVDHLDVAGVRVDSGKLSVCPDAG